MIHFLTLSLDSFPYLGHHLHQFENLGCDWDWSVVSGVAQPVHCTSWCRPMEPRYSLDGSHEYMLDLAVHHPRVKYYYRESWPGKCAMLNHALAQMKEPGILMEIDSDELWTGRQLEMVVNMFEIFPDRDCAYFYCDYRVGPNLRIVSRNCYGNNPGEWLRAWRYTPGVIFSRHEPPVFGAGPVKPFTLEETENLKLTFLHPAYALEKTVAFKEKYYGYKDAVAQWRALQANTVWPCDASQFLKWVPRGAVVDPVVKT